MPATVRSEYSSDAVSTSDGESGYVSGRSSQDSSPEIHFTSPHLVFLNRQLQNLEPQGALSGSSKFLDIHLTRSGRDFTMVHHLHPIFVPDLLVWPYRARDSRHAFKDEDSETSNGRHHIF